MSNYAIALSNRHAGLRLDVRALKALLRGLLAESAARASLSVAVVGDKEMQSLNSRYTGRKGPTDVLAFPYEQGADAVDGEVVVNADEAVRQAAQRSHSPEDELLLYVVHGVLHLTGYDDQDAPSRKLMHRRALEVLAAAGHPLES